jgi:hypothetical protein
MAMFTHHVIRYSPFAVIYISLGLGSGFTPHVSSDIFISSSKKGGFDFSIISHISARYRLWEVDVNRHVSAGDTVKASFFNELQGCFKSLDIQRRIYRRLSLGLEV